jgi:hypothetical protein
MQHQATYPHLSCEWRLSVREVVFPHCNANVFHWKLNWTAGNNQGRELSTLAVKLRSIKADRFEFIKRRQGDQKK